MRLVSFQVTNFRNILDSDRIAVDEGVTCLVGQNESGKSSLLHALRKLKPEYAGQSEFEALRDYPRWLHSPHKRRDLIDQSPVVQATFAVSDEDRAAVEGRYGDGVLTSAEIDVSIGYGFSRRILLTVDSAPTGQQAIDFVLDPDHDLRRELEPAAARGLSDLHDELDRRTESLRSQVDETEEAVPDEVQTLLELVDAVRLEIDGLRDHEDLLEAVGRFLDARIPNFFYFSDYSALPGKVRLDEVAATSNAPASDHMQTARALLELAGTEPGSLAEDDYEERKAELEAVSNELTQQTQEYWRQSKHLEIVMDVEKENTVRVDGAHAVAKVLHIRIKDRRHQYTGSFDDRSSGFRWFFSFLAAFSEFENREEPTIILLDEPALTLHGKAQADFLRFIEERLAPKCQVIYTTHSPFMVDTGHMDRVRIVEDTGPEQGSKTTSDVMGVGAESVFPLQGALGYDLAQSIFIGPHNLLVEGTSDWTYLTVLSDHLAGMGRQGLNHKWRLLPVGGMANVPTFVALLGKQLEVTVLVDSGTDGMQRINAMISKGLIKDKRLVQVKGIVDNANADIEDVFAVSDYLTLYNSAFSASLTEPDLTPGDRVIRRIAGATTGEDFDHGKPADILLRDRTSILESLTTLTLDRFEALFQTLNATNPDL